MKNPFFKAGTEYGAQSVGVQFGAWRVGFFFLRSGRQPFKAFTRVERSRQWRFWRVAVAQSFPYCPNCRAWHTKRGGCQSARRRCVDCSALIPALETWKVGVVPHVICGGCFSDRVRALQSKK